VRGALLGSRRGSRSSRKPRVQQVAELAKQIEDPFIEVIVLLTSSCISIWSRRTAGVARVIRAIEAVLDNGGR
jgi:hypothetical protein